MTLDPNGISELYLYDDKTKVETRIPIRYDYEQKGFYVDAIMGGTLEQQKLLAARIADKSLRSSKAHHAAQSASTFEKEHLSTVTRMLQEHDDVECLQCSKEAEIELADDVFFRCIGILPMRVAEQTSCPSHKCNEGPFNVAE